MLAWTILFSVLVTLWATLNFLGIVARCIGDQRAHLVRIHELQIEAIRRQQKDLLVANPVSINA